MKGPAIPPALPGFRYFVVTVPRNVASVFRGWNLPWHGLAIGLTAALVLSGLDWWYWVHSRWIAPAFVFPAIMLGTFLPVLVPLGVLLAAYARKADRLRPLGYLLGQAALIGSIVSSAYKAITGRLQPPLGQPLTHDVSREFHFGFLEHGIFWGWPSGHTTIAFAMATALVTYLPGHKAIKALALLYALYVGLAVSVSIHWCSDFLAGAIIGTVIGVVVGKAFRQPTGVART